MPPIARDEIDRRIKKFQAAMPAEGLDGALIVNHADLFYLSGTAQDAHLFVPIEGLPVLMVRRSFERAAEDSPLENVVPVKSLSELGTIVKDSASMTLRTLGMELDILPVNNFRIYEGLFPESEFRDVSPLIRALRQVKSPYEIALLRKAARINDALFAKARELLREGMTELEFAGLLEAEYRKGGHQGYVRSRQFNSEVFYGHLMSGVNLAVPSCSVGPTGGRGASPAYPQGASLKVIGRNEPVQVDYVAAVEGYMVDQARTYYIGEPPTKLARFHDLALEIQAAIGQRGGPGVKAEELYDLALDMARQAGQEDYFMGWPQPVPFVGHGVGLELDELPVIGKRSSTVLEPGMVMAIEPKFVFPGEGLAGVENTFLVTDKGLERLTLFDDAIQVVST
ncbi:MAG: Xaa-Pro peptidase family protein [Thermodesulfobacteriota bacterium]